MTDNIARKLVRACTVISLFSLLANTAFAQDQSKEPNSALARLVSRGMNPVEHEDANTTLDDVKEQDKFDRSFAIPDTPMRVRFFGYASGTALFDIYDKGPQDTLIPSVSGGIQPGIGHSHFQIAASRTNWGFEVRTPVPGSNKPLKLVIISGYSPLISAAAGGAQENHVKQLFANNEANVIAAAYVQMGNFLAGQYASNFMDIRSVPELLNFGGNAGAYGIAAPQFKYSFEFGCRNNNVLSVSVENPETDYTLVNARVRAPKLPAVIAPNVPITGSTDGTQPPFLYGPYFTSGIPSAFLFDPKTHDRVPDLVLSFRTRQQWGHLFLSGVVRELRVNGRPYTDEYSFPSVIGVEVPMSGIGLPRTAQKEVNAHSYGYALNLAAKVKFGCARKNNINGHIEWGYGLGRYALGTATQTAWIDLEKDPNRIERLYSWVGNIAYQHYWTEHLRSTFLYGFVFNQTNDQTPIIINKWIQSFVVNLMYSPSPIVRLGVEYIHQRRTFIAEPTELGLPKEGKVSRIEAQARLYF